jgi:hypothetical protein
MSVPLHAVAYGSSSIDVEVIRVGLAEERCGCSIFICTCLRAESFRALSGMRHVDQYFIDQLVKEWRASRCQVL